MLCIKPKDPSHIPTQKGHVDQPKKAKPHINPKRANHTSTQKVQSTHPVTFDTRGQQCATEMKCMGKPICLTKLIQTTVISLQTLGKDAF